VTVRGADGTIVTISSPFTYYPVTASYSANWAAKKHTTDLNAGITLGVRGVGSRRAELENSRFDADANFIKLRGELSHTHDLPRGWEGFVKAEGQVANKPLVNTEQIGGGGLDSVRGYLESEVLADNGVFGTVELRTPSLLGFLGKDDQRRDDNEWRLYGFFDAGAFGLRSALPEQEDSFTLASFGVGTRMRVLGHLNGSLDAAVPLLNQTSTKARDARLTFRVWADF
jgi:hemolysin activation/secretion protein